MKISGNSSATSSIPPTAATPRSSFALAGPSARLDPRTHAVRGDLADLRLADRVFAPHYAAAMPVSLAHDTCLRESADPHSAPVAELHADDVFEVLELAGANAWGVAQRLGLVGYIAASAIAQCAKDQR